MVLASFFLEKSSVLSSSFTFKKDRSDQTKKGNETFLFILTLSRIQHGSSVQIISVMTTKP